MGGDFLCPHPIWQQNTVPARSAFTQSGRAVRTPGLCPYSTWRPREGHADFPLLSAFDSGRWKRQQRHSNSVALRCVVRHGWREREGVRILVPPWRWRKCCLSRSLSPFAERSLGVSAHFRPPLCPSAPRSCSLVSKPSAPEPAARCM